MASSIARVLFVYLIWRAPLLSGSPALTDLIPVELQQFYEFIVKFGKSYSNAAEQAMRFDIFRNNLGIIQRLNNNIHDLAKYGVTKFSDLTPQEFEKKMLRRKISRPLRGRKWTAPETPSLHTRLQTRSLISTLNSSSLKILTSWVDDNPYYPAVENQGVTGLCVVFAVVGALSILYSDHQERTISLSKQQVADCAPSLFNGESVSFHPVYKYLRKHYLAVEDDYPFRASRVPRPCKKNAVAKGVATMADYRSPETDKQIKEALRYGPLVASVVGFKLQHYVSGVITDCPNEHPNHSVVIVEYGIETTENGTAIPYFLLRNSWGSDHGTLNGHIMVQRGTCSVEKEIDWIELKVKRTGGSVGCFSGLCKLLKKKS